MCAVCNCTGVTTSCKSTLIGLLYFQKYFIIKDAQKKLAFKQCLKTCNYAVAIYSVAKQWEAAVLLIKTTLGSTDNLIKNTIYRSGSRV